MPTHILPLGIDNIATFRADDRILLGEGVFETLRVDNQCPCYSRLHWQRMCEAAEQLGLALDLPYDLWHSQLIQCIQIAGIQTGGIKAILSGGRASRGLASHADTSCLALHAFDYTPQKKSLNLISAAWLRDAKNPTYQLKSVNYLEAILARRQALGSGADDALFFNLNHYATETTVANLFIVKQDKILTPPLSHGVLGGIIRGRILNLCRDCNLVCLELPVDKKMILEADAVFITNSLQGIQSIKSFDSYNVPVEHSLITLLRKALATDESRFS